MTPQTVPRSPINGPPLMAVASTIMPDSKPTADSPNTRSKAIRTALIP